MYLSDVVISNLLMNLTELNQIVKCPRNGFNLKKKNIKSNISKEWMISISKKFDVNIFLTVAL